MKKLIRLIEPDFDLKNTNEYSVWNRKRPRRRITGF
jgi:hypothetical protein